MEQIELDHDGGALCPLHEAAALITDNTGQRLTWSANSFTRKEIPMITDMVGAMSHLEHLVEVVGTPEQELATYTTPITPERHRDYVLGNAARMRRALDQLTAPYETAADTSTTTADNTAA